MSFEPDDLAFAFTGGFTRAFWVVAFTAVAGAVAAIVMIRGPVLAPDEDARVQSTPVGAPEGRRRADPAGSRRVRCALDSPVD